MTQLSMKLTMILTVIFLSATLIACGSARPPEPRKCNSAFECTLLRGSTDGECLPAASEKKTSFAVHNNHESRKIFVSYQERIRHVNTPKPDDVVTKMVSARSGESVFIGCQRTRGLLEGQFQEHSFNIVSACFSDECPASPPTKPSRERDPQAKCLDLCLDGDRSCAFLDLSDPALDPDFKSSVSSFFFRSAQVQLPGEVDMSRIADIVNKLNNDQSCTRDPVVFSAESLGVSQFSASGSSCSVHLSINHRDFSELELRFPGLWAGTYERTTHVDGFSYGSSQIETSPLISLKSIDSGHWENDPVIAIEGVKTPERALVLTGQKYHCGLIHGLSGD